MGSRVSDVVESYATLASSLLERWSAHASKLASRVDADEFDAAGAAAEVTECASLATESAFLLAAEALEAVAILTGCEGAGNLETSQPFHAPAVATLRLAGDLAKGPLLHKLPTTALTIQPPRLGPGETEFKLCADTTGHRGATYVGKVEASTDTGTTLVDVWITVP